MPSGEAVEASEAVVKPLGSLNCELFKLSFYVPVGKSVQKYILYIFLNRPVCLGRVS